ncbi:hypothetical protein U2F10_21750 [Leptothoe sp. EHU-05/26/07-4]
MSVRCEIPTSKWIDVIQGHGDAVLAGSGYTWMQLNEESIEPIEFTATIASGSTTLDA